MTFTKESFDKLFKNEDCFCGSKRKYHDCHALKVYKNPVQIQIDQKKFTFRSRQCPAFDHGEQCRENVIASHSQQRKGPLKEIEEDGHVMGFNRGPNAKTVATEELSFSSISARKASTFPGLCNKHDTLAFKSLEQGPLKPNFQSSLELAYRNVLYEAVIHTDLMLFLYWLRSVPKFEFHFDLSESHTELENMRYYSTYNRQQVSLLQKILARKSVRKLYFCSKLIDKKLPFCATGNFCIENDFEGRKLQKFSETTRNFSYAQLSVLPQRDGTTLVSLSATDDKDKSSAIGLIESFSRVTPKETANACLRLALEHTENIYFRSSWINSLDDSSKQSLISRFDDSVVFQAGAQKKSNSLSRMLDIELKSHTRKEACNL